MVKSIIGTFRTKTALVALSALCTVLNTPAQSTDRFHIVDKAFLETLIKSGAIDYWCTFLIAEPDAGMAMQTTLNSASTALLPQAVTLQDSYVETAQDEKGLQFTFEYLGESSKYDGMEMRIMKGSNGDILGTSGSKFVYEGNNAKETFTLIFDETDDTKVQLKTGYYSNGTYYNINYTGPTASEGFKLTADDTKNLSLYIIDNFNATLEENPVDETSNDIRLTLNPTKTVSGIGLYINYILNDGEEVSAEELLASEHRESISWKGYQSGPLDIILPNYDPDATTLWAMPVTSRTPAYPYGPVFHALYSDISTGISSPATEAVDVTPVYHTLQGIQVSRPEKPGIYLCRRGSEVSKIIVR